MLLEERFYNHKNSLSKVWYPRPDLNRHELGSTDFKSIMSTIPSRGHKLESQYYSKKLGGASFFSST